MPTCTRFMAAWTCSGKPVKRSMRSETPLGASDIFTMAPDICNSTPSCPDFYQLPLARLSHQAGMDLPQYSPAEET